MEIKIFFFLTIRKRSNLQCTKQKIIFLTLSGSGTMLRYQNESVKEFKKNSYQEELKPKQNSIQEEFIEFKRFQSRGIIVKA
jgi:hypothetical protein